MPVRYEYSNDLVAPVEELKLGQWTLRIDINTYRHSTELEYLNAIEEQERLFAEAGDTPTQTERLRKQVEADEVLYQFAAKAFAPSNPEWTLEVFHERLSPPLVRLACNFLEIRFRGLSPNLEIFTQTETEVPIPIRSERTSGKSKSSSATPPARQLRSS